MCVCSHMSTCCTCSHAQVVCTSLISTCLFSNVVHVGTIERERCTDLVCLLLEGQLGRHFLRISFFRKVKFHLEMFL